MDQVSISLQRLSAAIEVAEAAERLCAYDDLGAEELCDECAPEEPGEYIAVRHTLYYAVEKYGVLKRQEGA